MAVGLNDYDSQIYRKLFEFIQKEGLEVLVAFIKDYENSLHDDYLTKAILEGKHDTLSFVRRHSAVSSFLRDLKTKGIPCFLRDRNFPNFAKGLTEEVLHSYIEGAGQLEELCIGSVSILPIIDDSFSYQTILFYGKDKEVTDIYKQYTNGKIAYTYNPASSNIDSYDTYNASISFPKQGSRFVINAENHANGFQYRYGSVSDFKFDISTLPSEEELSSYVPPKSLTESKIYIKR